MQNEKTLWQALQNQEEWAFEQLYRQNVRTLCDYGVRFDVEETVVLDIVQDIFVAIWQKKGQLPDVNRVDFYLMTILRHRIFRHLKAEKRIIHPDNDAANAFEAIANFDYTPSVEESIVSAELAESHHLQLQKAFDVLSVRQREAIYLRFYQNLSYAEISELLEVEQQSAYNLIFRGLEVLRKNMTYLLATVFFAV